MLGGINLWPTLSEFCFIRSHYRWAHRNLDRQAELADWLGLLSSVVERQLDEYSLDYYLWKRLEVATTCCSSCWLLSARLDYRLAAGCVQVARMHPKLLIIIIIIIIMMVVIIIFIIANQAHEASLSWRSVSVLAKQCSSKEILLCCSWNVENEPAKMNKRFVSAFGPASGCVLCCGLIRVV